jgi:hypothetical protein
MRRDKEKPRHPHLLAGAGVARPGDAGTYAPHRPGARGLVLSPISRGPSRARTHAQPPTPHPEPRLHPDPPRGEAFTRGEAGSPPGPIPPPPDTPSPESPHHPVTLSLHASTPIQSRTPSPASIPLTHPPALAAPQTPQSTRCVMNISTHAICARKYDRLVHRAISVQNLKESPVTSHHAYCT